MFPGDWLRSLLAGLAVLGMSITFPALYLFSGELLPTVVRNVGLGASSMCARVGSMAAPFVLALVRHTTAYAQGVPVVDTPLRPITTVNKTLPKVVPEGRGRQRGQSLFTEDTYNTQTTEYTVRTGCAPM